MALTKEEINRKLLHIFSGTLIPAGMLYLPRVEGFTSWSSVVVLGICAALSILIEILRFRFPNIARMFVKAGASVLRQSEQNTWTGSTYIFLSAFFCSVIFFHHPHISCIALSLFILGDAVAAIVGISIGRIKIGKKSLEGSAACFFLGLFLFFFVYPNVPTLLDKWEGQLPLSLILIVSFANMLFELFPVSFGKSFPINDNLSVPIITGLIMLWLQPILA